MEISVHDNRLLLYCVRSNPAEIVLHTVYDESQPHAYTDVVFSGVVAYCFENDSFGTIIFDIYEDDVAAIYAGDRERFAAGQKYGWPGPWNTSEQAALEYFVSHDVKAYVLSSSCGMNGWVLSHGVTKSAVTAPM